MRKFNLIKAFYSPMSQCPYITVVPVTCEGSWMLNVINSFTSDSLRIKYFEKSSYIVYTHTHIHMHINTALYY